MRSFPCSHVVGGNETPAAVAIEQKHGIKIQSDAPGAGIMRHLAISRLRRQQLVSALYRQEKNGLLVQRRHRHQINGNRPRRLSIDQARDFGRSPSMWLLPTAAA